MAATPSYGHNMKIEYQPDTKYLREKESSELNNLFCWCVENLQPFPLGEGSFLDEVKRRLKPAIVSSAEINALPERIRNFIMQLETNRDPSGNVREIVQLKESVAALEAEIERQRLRIAAVAQRMRTAFEHANRPFTIDVQDWLKALEGEAIESSLASLLDLVAAINDDPNVLRLSRQSVAALVAARDLLKRLGVKPKGSERCDQ